MPIYPKIGFFNRLINKLIIKFGLKIDLLGAYRSTTVDFIYPCSNYDFAEGIFSSIRRIRKIYWIPDFQEKYYPEYFSQEEVMKRDRRTKDMVNGKSRMAFSSKSVKDDFDKYYPENTNHIKILHFASILPDISNLNIQDPLKKYSVPEKYFITPYQFWRHKNHKVVIQAIELLKLRGVEISLVFTGKDDFGGESEYSKQQKQLTIDLGLSKNVIFLGFIDRKDQLLLMKNSIAVIQPSLFEGWSTVVEDSKALGAKLIVSDIPVHREQYPINEFLFNPYDPNDLADKMIREMNVGNIPVELKRDYSSNIIECAYAIIGLDH